MVKRLNPTLLVWFLPIAFALHQIEEYFGGFLDWYPTVMNATLSSEDFILINSIGLSIVLLFSIVYSFGVKNNFVFVVIGTLLFVNGIVHLLLTLVTQTYSPGVISGLIILIPLGGIIFRRIYPNLPANQRTPSIVIGILLLFMVSIIARGMAIS